MSLVDERFRKFIAADFSGVPFVFDENIPPNTAKQGMNGLWHIGKGTDLNGLMEKLNELARRSQKKEKKEMKAEYRITQTLPLQFPDHTQEHSVDGWHVLSASQRDDGAIFVTWKRMVISVTLSFFRSEDSEL